MEFLENTTVVSAIFFGGAVFFSILINRLLLKFSKNLGTRQEDDLLRWSSESKPSVGGLSFFILFLISLASVSILNLETASMDRQMLFGLFSACTLGFVIGLADDAYNTRPLLKFLGQLLCANILVTSGIYIEITPNLLVNYLFTVLWTIGIMNSINMLDNMDGITASISSAIVISVIMLIYLQKGSGDADMVIMLGVLAGLVGFLFFNWHPSKMFMGDTGSQFLGVFLAAISIVYLWKFRDDTVEYFQIKQFLLPMLAFIVPIIDTTTVFVRRILRGQSPFVGGRDHTTHHLAYLGLGDGQVATLLLFISLISTAIIYFLYLVSDTWRYGYSIIVLAYFFVLALILQILYEAGKKRNQAKVKEEEMENETNRSAVI